MMMMAAVEEEVKMKNERISVFGREHAERGHLPPSRFRLPID